MGLFIANSNGKNRKIILGFAITANLLIFFYFKYLGFTIDLINPLLSIFHVQPITIQAIVLPIGISFYTFQSISYLIDVYKNSGLVQKNILDLGLFITFFPQLIAGPIVRYHDINEQIAVRKHTATVFTEGIERFIVGLSKKVLLANTMAEVADSILAMPLETVSPYYSWVGILAYTVQLFYDFSGYSDMAIGLGKMFGFKIMENFNYPYISKSITEFWRRWHISLSSWFKDYLYIPLGGSRKGKTRTVINLFAVFFITGLWHGAAINFIIWGMINGILQFMERILGKTINRKFKDCFVKSAVSHIYMLSAFVLSLVFFRVGTAEGLAFLLHLFKAGNASALQNYELALLVDIRFYIIFGICVLAAFPWWRKIKIPARESFSLTYVCGKYVVLLGLFALSICNLASSSYNPFIYFRF
jgi:alginate O-acetyltransferase complex protein AlgI